MPLRWRFHDDNDNYVEADQGVPTGATEVISHAEELSVGTSSLAMDDRNINLAHRGHRVIWAEVEETVASGSNAGPIVWAGFTASRDIFRGDAPLERQWTVSIVDPNTIPERRIGLDAEWNRPAETDVARMQWLLTTEAMELVTDTIHLSTATPVQMDATDYRKQRAADVINDCMQQSGKNCFISFKEGASGRPAFWIWYGRDSLSAWDSGIRITNNLADIDSSTTFAAAEDTKLTRDPSRVYSGVVVDYDGGYVYAERAATAERFTERDATMRAENVKTKAKATARAFRYLADISTEEDIITTAIIVEPEQANILREGHLVEVKLTHIGDYSDWVSMRVLKRTFRELAPDVYQIAVELTPPTEDVADSTGGNVYGILWKPHSSATQAGWALVWEETGDNPPAGYTARPTVGLIEAVVDDSLEENRDHLAWKVTGTGTIDIAFCATWGGVLVEGTTIVRWWISKNGLLVAEDTEEYTVAGLTGAGGSKTVTATGVEVEPDDIIRGHVGRNRLIEFFGTPQGVGISEERLEITGGTLA